MFSQEEERDEGTSDCHVVFSGQGRGWAGGRGRAGAGATGDKVFLPCWRRLFMLSSSVGKVATTDNHDLDKLNYYLINQQV